jgi:hypothetical protein
VIRKLFGISLTQLVQEKQKEGLIPLLIIQHYHQHTQLHWTNK